ncbi:MAG: TonB-dependent receptor [Acidobacteriota bacterium]
MRPSCVIGRAALALFFALQAFGADAAAQTSQPSARQGDAVQDLRAFRVRVGSEAQTLAAILAKVEAQTRFTFVYMKDEIPPAESFTLDHESTTLDVLLGELSRRFSLAFNRINDRIIIRRLPQAKTESVTLSGEVRDYSTNEPLPFATIVIEGTALGASSDAAGRFSIALPPGPCLVRCAFVGYKTEELPIELSSDTHTVIMLTSTDVILQDVTVYAHRIDDGTESDVNALTLQSETIKHVTSLIPDVMRSVQMLPGVSTNNEFSSRFNVRGGNQDENLVIVNGTQVYDPFHVKEVSNASIGIFNADMIRKMDLITGGFTARYGDKMSSVLAIEYREGSRDRFEGMAGLSLLELNAVAEGPIGDKGSFIIGGRKSYFEYLMKLIDMEDGAYFHPSFYDVQGVFSYAPAPHSKLVLKLIHSGDDFSADAHRKYEPAFTWIGQDQTGARYTNHQQITDSSMAHATYYSDMAALQLTQILSSRAVIRSEISFYGQRENENSWRDNIYDYTGVNPQRTYFYNSRWVRDYRNELRIRTVEFNASLDYQFSSRYGFKAGADIQSIEYMQSMLQSETIDEFTNEYSFPDTTASHRLVNTADQVQDGIDVRSYKLSAYLENIVQVSDRLLLNAGARADYFDLNRDLTLSPRLNLSYRAAPGLMLRAAWGHYYQSPVYRQIAYPFAADTNTQSQHAVHYIIGLDYEAAAGESSTDFVRIKAEIFRKQYDNLITASVTTQGVVNYSRKNDAEGYAHGIDMQLIYSTPVFYGWISYGYLVARQTAMLNGIETTFPRYTDQRHTLAATGEFRLGRDWSLSTRFVYGSGYPYTPSSAAINFTKRIWEWQPAPVPNSDYLPVYTRVDLNIAKEFHLFGSLSTVFLDVSNLFNSTNIQAYHYRFDSTGRPYKEEIKLWPILPSLGFAVRL